VTSLTIRAVDAFRQDGALQNPRSIRILPPHVSRIV